jgi:hypothetical protein
MRKQEGACRVLRSVSVDACRVRLQTGAATAFIDARTAEDQAASRVRITGSIRIPSDGRTFRPPYHKRNYMVVYCA